MRYKGVAALLFGFISADVQWKSVREPHKPRRAPLINAFTSAKSDNSTWLSERISRKSLYATAIFGDLAYVAGEGGVVYQYDILNHKTKNYAIEGNTWINCLDASENLLISGHSDGTLNIWNRKAMRIVKTLHDHTDLIETCRIVDQLILTGSWDETASVYNVSDHENPRTLFTNQLITHNDIVYSIDVNHEFILTGSWDHTMKIWSLNNGTLVHTFHDTGLVDGARWIDKNRIMSIGVDKTLKLWRLPSRLTPSTRDVWKPLQTLDQGDLGLIAVKNGLIYSTRRKMKQVAVWKIADNGLIKKTPMSVIQYMGNRNLGYINDLSVSAAWVLTAGTGGKLSVTKTDL